MTWPPVLEAKRWQMGKLYLPAVRSDKEECVVTHQDILWAAASGRPGWQKKDAYASNYVQQGYRRYAPNRYPREDRGYRLQVFDLRARVARVAQVDDANGVRAISF